MAAESIPTLAHNEGSEMAECPVWRHRLPGYHLLFCSKTESRPQESQRGRSRIAENVRETRNLASGAGAACRSRCRRSVRQRFGCNDIQGKAERDGCDLQLLLRSGQGASGLGTAVSWLCCSVHRQFFRDTQLGSLHGWVLVVDAKRCPL